MSIATAGLNVSNFDIHKVATSVSVFDVYTSTHPLLPHPVLAQPCGARCASAGVAVIREVPRTAAAAIALKSFMVINRSIAG